VAGDVTVLAASSLTEAFTRIGQDFEDKYPGTRVAFSFNASSTLATQIEQGVPADVFAAADTATLQRLVHAGKVQEPGGVAFARNRLEIAVAPGNPKRITTLADTLKPNVTLVLCAPEVPCGKFARQVYRKAKLELPEVPTGANVKDTLSKVTLGEADAAIVYVTDVKAANREVEGVELPPAQNVAATSPIALLAGRPNPVAAKAFVQYVSSRAGQRTLRRFGFRLPP
jgi:molybdate transport system substrate-binding protein